MLRFCFTLLFLLFAFRLSTRTPLLSETYCFILKDFLLGVKTGCKLPLSCSFLASNAIHNNRSYSTRSSKDTFLAILDVSIWMDITQHLNSACLNSHSIFLITMTPLFSFGEHHCYPSIQHPHFPYLICLQSLGYF